MRHHIWGGGDDKLTKWIGWLQRLVEEDGVVEKDRVIEGDGWGGEGDGERGMRYEWIGRGGVAPCWVERLGCHHAVGLGGPHGLVAWPVCHGSILRWAHHEILVPRNIISCH
jgi:hypothetical protein